MYCAVINHFYVTLLFEYPCEVVIWTMSLKQNKYYIINVEMKYRNRCEKCFSLFVLAVSEYRAVRMLDASLHFMITNFHMEFDPQVKVSHDMKYEFFNAYLH